MKTSAIVSAGDTVRFFRPFFRQKRPRRLRGGPSHELVNLCRLHHAVHTAHAAHTAGHACFLLFLRQFGHHRLGGDHETGHGGGVLQCGTRDFGGIQDSHRHHVAVFAGGGVVTVVTFAFLNFVKNHGLLVAGIGHDLAQRLFHRAVRDRDADILVVVVALEILHALQGANQCNAAARDDAFFHCGAGGVQGIFDAGLLLLHFHLGGGTDFNHCHTAGELRHALLQLLLVVVGGRFLDLGLDLLNASLDVGLLAGTIDDGAVLFGDHDLLGGAQVVQGGLLKRETHFFTDHLAVGQNSDVLQHGLAAVAETGGLHRAHFDDAADGVHHQSGEGFAFHIFGDDQQRTAGFRNAFQHGQQLADVGNLLLVDENQRVIELGAHVLLVVDEVGRQIAAVELHAFHHVELVVEARAFFDGDDAFFADLVHGVGDDLADGLIGIGGDGAHLGDGLAVGAGLGHLLELGDRSGHGLVDTALQVHRVHAGGHRLQAFAQDGLGQDGGGGGAVTGAVGRLRSDFLHHLRAHVLELVLELALFRDGHAVHGDRRGAEALLEHHVATLGTQRHFDRIGQNVHALDHTGTGVVTKHYFFRFHSKFSRFEIRINLRARP